MSAPLPGGPGPWITVSPAARRQTLCVGEKSMQVQVVIAPHTTMPTHSHPHEQLVYVARGSVTFHVGNTPVELTAGQSLFLPGDVPHGCVTGESETVLIDTFCPLREDFLAQDEQTRHAPGV
jgi:quercetin dioxygenase-like cupin family protein